MLAMLSYPDRPTTSIMLTGHSRWRMLPWLSAVATGVPTRFSNPSTDGYFTLSLKKSRRKSNPAGVCVEKDYALHSKLYQPLLRTASPEDHTASAARAASDRKALERAGEAGTAEDSPDLISTSPGVQQAFPLR